MPKKLQPEDVRKQVFQMLEIRLTAGGTEYGPERWADRSASSLGEEAVEELIDYVAWRALQICNMIYLDENMLKYFEERYCASTPK